MKLIRTMIVISTRLHMFGKQLRRRDERNCLCTPDVKLTKAYLEIG